MVRRKAINFDRKPLKCSQERVISPPKLIKYIGKLDGDWDISNGKPSLPQDYIASLFEIGYAAYNDEGERIWQAGL